MPPATRGVRKQLTVLFADLAGWMELVERFDAEDVDRMASRFHHEAGRVVSAHGGIVESAAGGVVRAAFGFPVPHEDDALRALRAAFELGRAVAALSDDLENGRIEARVALSTGDVFVGLDGERPHVAGDAATIAARLGEEVAKRGEVLIGATTRGLVGDAVVAEALAKSRWPAARTGGGVAALGLTRRSTATRSAIAPFVGRTDELAQLEEPSRKRRVRTHHGFACSLALRGSESHDSSESSWTASAAGRPSSRAGAFRTAKASRTGPSARS